VEYGKIEDNDTTLTIFEKFPFPIKRIYYMQGMCTEEIRGKHKHKKNRQILICVHGSCTILIEYNLIKVHQDDYIILEPDDWHEMFDFTPDCILLVLASEEYDPDDYIREKNSR